MKFFMKDFFSKCDHIRTISRETGESQRRIYNPVKHLRWSFSAKIANEFSLYYRC